MIGPSPGGKMPPFTAGRMPAATWDEDRIDRCGTHMFRPDGKRDTFCCC